MQNAEMVPKFQVAIASFSCSPPDINSSKLKPLAVKANELSFQIMEFAINSENQNPAAPLSSYYF
jgi:hypothetical protein